MINIINITTEKYLSYTVQQLHFEIQNQLDEFNQLTGLDMTLRYLDEGLELSSDALQSSMGGTMFSLNEVLAYLQGMTVGVIMERVSQSSI